MIEAALTTREKSRYADKCAKPVQSPLFTRDMFLCFTRFHAKHQSLMYLDTTMYYCKDLLYHHKLPDKPTGCDFDNCDIAAKCSSGKLCIENSLI